MMRFGEAKKFLLDLEKSPRRIAMADKNDELRKV
jgi:hypothetical protein